MSIIEAYANAQFRVYVQGSAQTNDFGRPKVTTAPTTGTLYKCRYAQGNVMVEGTETGRQRGYIISCESTVVVDADSLLELYGLDSVPTRIATLRVVAKDQGDLLGGITGVQKLQCVAAQQVTPVPGD